MEINLSPIGYEFKNKPLLIGGKALEYYGIRKAGADIDLVAAAEDPAELRRMYPDNIKDIYGDIGVCEYGFEIWNRICNFTYEDLRENAIELPTCRVASLEKLVLLKTIAMGHEKYLKDLYLLSKYILDVQYGKKTLPG